MRLIEMKHLILIDSIHQVGSLKNAAERLHLTQSALSHQLKDLETRLETKIFHRVNNTLVFTPSGKAIRDTAKEVLERMQVLESTLQETKKDTMKDYIHGYSQAETVRLDNQAKSVEQLLHWDSIWEKGSLILEAGCGVGSQTKIIAPLNPESRFVCVDLSAKSLRKAEEAIDQHQIENVNFQHADILKLPFQDDHFDHVFLCFVLEHLSKPMEAIRELKRVLKPKGTITLIEGDHGSTYFYPDSTRAMNVVQAQVRLQKGKGGNPNIGRELYPILEQSGFTDIAVSPRQVYVDDSKPDLVEGFIKNTFTAMMEGISAEALAQKMISKQELDGGIEDLYRTAAGGGTFCYTFFKAMGRA